MTSTEATPPAPEQEEKYDHMILLDKLEEHARAAAAASSSPDEHPPSEWTLANDAALASFLHEFSSHVQRRAAAASRAIQALEDRARAVGTDVSSTVDDFLLRSDAQFVENRVDEEEEHPGGGAHGANRRSSSTFHEDVDEEEVEENALHEGMKALSIFYDPAKQGKSEGDTQHHHVADGGDNRYFGMENEEDDACYYDSSPGDVFNQRLLPFVVGSRDFMESTDAGLGPDDIESVDGGVEEEDADDIGGENPVVFLEDDEGPDDLLG